jgi:hypothetical protein
MNRSLESKANEEQEAPISDSNNNDDKKIREEIENLREGSDLNHNHPSISYSKYNKQNPLKSFNLCP